MHHSSCCASAYQRLVIEDEWMMSWVTGKSFHCTNTYSYKKSEFSYLLHWCLQSTRGKALINKLDTLFACISFFFILVCHINCCKVGKPWNVQLCFFFLFLIVLTSYLLRLRAVCLAYTLHSVQYRFAKTWHLCNIGARSNKLTLAQIPYARMQIFFANSVMFTFQNTR